MAGEVKDLVLRIAVRAVETYFRVPEVACQGLSKLIPVGRRCRVRPGAAKIDILLFAEKVFFLAGSGHTAIRKHPQRQFWLVFQVGTRVRVPSAYVTPHDR